MISLQSFLYKGYKQSWLLKHRKKYFDLILRFSARVEWLSLVLGGGVGRCWATDTNSSRKGAPFSLLAPKGKPCHSGATREACVGSHRKGVFGQECSGSTVERHAFGWHVLCLRPVILGNFYRVASQMSWLLIEHLLICVCSKENYSIAMTKMMLSILTLLCVL